MAKEPESNPWPGFVDALSTTLLVFVFLVVVLVLVVTGLSVQVGQDIAAALVEQQVKAAGKSDEANVGNAISLKSDSAKEIVSEAKADEVQIKTVNLSTGEERIRVKYQDLSALMNPEANDELNQWIQENLEKIKSRKVIIVGLLHSSDVATTTSYYVSFNRVMAIRKVFTDLGVPKQNLKVRVDDSGKENKNEVLIQLAE
ncbi:hypothetical protein [Endozoicomonas sp. Mp262]|uniref:hypothetical protein n=1 Tax=Endozoicomonas sp. Mp262 TaxID=2919499 RepID=UPI0021DA8EEF